MALMPTPQALMIGVITAAGNLLIFQHFVGASVLDVRSADPHNGDIEKAERTALAAATVFTVAISGFAKSWETFAIAGVAIIAADFGIKHANAVHPMTGKAVPAGGAGGYPAADVGSYPNLPDYADTDSGEDVAA